MESLKADEVPADAELLSDIGDSTNEESASENISAAEKSPVIHSEPKMSYSHSDDVELASPDSMKKPELEWKAGKQEWLIMVLLLIVSLMASIDTTILVPVLPVLAAELHGSATDTFWAGTSYLLANAAVQPFFAALSDIFGRQVFLFIGVLLFTVGTAICCTANDFTQLLAGRSVQGIGGGGIIVLNLVILTDIIPLRQRPTYNGIIQIAWALGTITGPLIGGGIVEHTTWRWIFYLNFPLCGIALAMIPLVLRLEMKTTSLRSKLARVDWVGGGLFVASLTSFLIAITWGGVQFAWNSFRTLVPILLGLFGICLIVAWEKWGTTQPFLRLHLFNSRSAILAYIICVFQGLVMLGALYYIPFYLSAVKNMSPIRTGVSLLPITASLVPTSVIIGAIMTRTGRSRWALWSGWVFMCVGYGLLILLNQSTSTVAWVWIFLCVGFAHGLILMPMIFGVQAMAKSEDVAYAAAMYAFLRTFGQAIGVAIGGTVFQNLLRHHLEDKKLPSDIAPNAEGFLTTLKALPITDPFRVEVIDAYAQAFHGVFGVLLGVAGLALILSLGIARFSLDRKDSSEHRLSKKP